MKILAVCQYYYPEPFRIHEVLEELVNRGHDVTVLTGLPNYPMGVIPDEYKDGQRRYEEKGGVKIIRVNEIPRSEGKIGLAKNYVSFCLNGSIKALKLKKDFDVIFVYQLSPILMAIPAYVAKWFSRTKNIAIYCLDLWPESLVSMGIGHDSLFYKFMKWVSVRIYDGAYCIAYTSRMFKNYFVEDLGLKGKKYKYIPQFADELFSNIDGDESEEDYKDTIDYVFAGNIGEMQSVETIIQAAALTKNEKIRWHIVGDGSKFKDCVALAAKLGLGDKIIFYGRMPVEAMPGFYEMADAMIVTLADNRTISYTLPGKTQSYMAAGKAIIAAADGETQIVIKKANCGLSSAAEDAQGLAEIADEMAERDYRQFGINARKYYDENFSKKSHVDSIEKLLKSTAKGRK